MDLLVLLDVLGGWETSGLHGSLKWGGDLCVLGPQEGKEVGLF